MPAELPADAGPGGPRTHDSACRDRCRGRCGPFRQTLARWSDDLLVSAQGSRESRSLVDKFSASLGVRLRAARRQRGWSLGEVEAFTDGEFKASVVGAYERGERAISVQRLTRLAEVYGVGPTELFPGSRPADGPVIDIDAVCLRTRPRSGGPVSGRHPVHASRGHPRRGAGLGQGSHLLASRDVDRDRFRARLIYLAQFRFPDRIALDATIEASALCPLTKSKRTLRVPSHHLLLDLLGDSDRHLRQVEDHFPEVRFVARGDEIALKGDEVAVEKARTVLGELLILVQEGHQLDAGRVDEVVKMVRDEVPSPSGSSVTGYRWGVAG